MRYDRARENLDRHPNYILAAHMASGTWLNLATASSADCPKSRHADGSSYADIYLPGPCTGR